MKADPILTRFLEQSRRLSSNIKTVYLFGSRARGTERPDSDYDLLLVVEEGFSLPEKDALYDVVMEVLLETGRLLSLKIFKEEVFHRLTAMGTPFMRHVAEEGVRVG